MEAQITKVHYFKEINDFLKVCNFTFENKVPGFVIFNYDEVSPSSWINLSAYRQNYFEISLEITKGCSFKIDQFDFPAAGNRLSFISPHRLYSVEAHMDYQKTFKGFTIFFSSDFLPSGTINGQFFRDFPFFSLFNSPFISLEKEVTAAFADIFNKIYQEYKTYDVLSKNVILHYLHVLFLLGKRHYRSTMYTHHSVNREQEIYSAFELLLQKHFLELTSVKHYADKLHVSPKHLSETIKKVSGKSALQMIHQAQVNHAKALLYQTTMTITQIADELKFENLDYFSVFFRRHTGISPLKFRNSQNNFRLS